jgi:cobalt-zinc-cadmium efflux system outer membrane protein
MKTFIIIPTACLLLWTQAKGDAEEGGIATPSFVEAQKRRAVATHPKASAARAQSEAARASIGTIRLWQDPSFGAGVMAAEKSMRQDDGDIMASVEQMLPRKGLYRAEKRRAEAESQSRGSEQRVAENELGQAVAGALLEIALADELIKLQTENVGWLETIVKTAQERAKNPDSSGTEALRLEAELVTQHQMLAAKVRQRTQFARTLNLLLGRGADANWRPMALASEIPQVASIQTLAARLKRTNPKLDAMRHMAASAEAGIEAARQSRKPVFSVEAAASAYSGGDYRSTTFMFKMSLPWFNRRAYDADVAKAEQLRAAAEGEAQAEELELLTKLAALVTEADNNRQTAEAYRRDVLPKTEQALETTQNAWISSKATLLEVLEARRALLNARQELKRSIAALHVAYHSIEALTETIAIPASK